MSLYLESVREGYLPAITLGTIAGGAFIAYLLGGECFTKWCDKVKNTAKNKGNPPG